MKRVFGQFGTYAPSVLLFIGVTCASGGAASEPARNSPMSIRDTLEFREVREIQMAPDGNAIAYVIRHANLEGKRNDDSLVLLSVADVQSRVLQTAENLTHIVWDQSQKFIYGLVKEGNINRIVRVEAATGALSVLWETGDKLDAFALSPDGRICVAATVGFSSSEANQARIDFGLVYEWGSHSAKTLINGDYTEPETEHFIVIRTDSKNVQEVGQIPFTGIRDYGFVQKISIAPDNRRAAIQVARFGEPNKGGSGSKNNIGVLDLQKGTWQEVISPESILTEVAAVWLNDSERLFFVIGGRDSRQSKIFHVSTKEIESLAWADMTSPNWITGASYDGATESIFVHQRSSLLHLFLRDRKKEEIPAIFDDPSFSADYSSFAFLSESSEEQPEIAVCVLKGGKTRRLTKLNPYLDQRSLARVEKINITNSYGTETSAYLVYPVNYSKDRRYPLILASYGFTGKFLITAEWHTTFPVQTLAGQGYALLLVNEPVLKSAQNLVGDPVKARENEGWQVLSNFESAVQLMVERGIADPGKVGLYGWSYGCYDVEFMLAHSKLPFTAACVGEGGAFNPGGYWLFGIPAWPKVFENTFGGPFTAKTAAAYLEFCPVLSVDRVKTPLLMEFKRDGSVMGLEFFTPLRMLGVPAEMVVYEGEEHNFVRPTSRFASMNRKVDWFNFWMLDKEDPDPAKVEQYVRWREMRATWKRDKEGRN